MAEPGPHLPSGLPEPRLLAWSLVVGWLQWSPDLLRTVRTLSEQHKRAVSETVAVEPYLQLRRHLERGAALFTERRVALGRLCGVMRKWRLGQAWCAHVADLPRWSAVFPSLPCATVDFSSAHGSTLHPRPLSPFNEVSVVADAGALWHCMPRLTRLTAVVQPLWASQACFAAFLGDGEPASLAHVLTELAVVSRHGEVTASAQPPLRTRLPRLRRLSVVGMQGRHLEELLGACAASAALAEVRLARCCFDTVHAARLAVGRLSAVPSLRALVLSRCQADDARAWPRSLGEARALVAAARPAALPRVTVAWRERVLRRGPAV